MCGARKSLASITRIYYVLTVVCNFGEPKNLKYRSNCTSIFQSGWKGKVYTNRKPIKFYKITNGITYMTNILLLVVTNNHKISVAYNKKHVLSVMQLKFG